ILLAGRTLPPAPGASRMAALRALHPDRKARGYSQKDTGCATRKMGPGLVFFAAIWRGLFFLGHGRFECTPSLSAHANFSAKPGTCVWAGSQISGYIGSSMRKPVVIGNFRIRGTNSQPIQGIDARTAWKNHVLGMAAVLDGGDPGRWTSAPTVIQ